MFTLQILIIGIIIIITRPRPAFGRLGLGGSSCKKLLTGQLLMPRFADEIWIIKNFWQLLHSEPKRDITRWEESTIIIYFHNNQTGGHFFVTDRPTDRHSIMIYTSPHHHWHHHHRAKSNPRPMECLARLKSTPQQSWSYRGTFSVSRQESNPGPLGWQPPPLATRLSEAS